MTDAITAIANAIVAHHIPLTEAHGDEVYASEPTEARVALVVASTGLDPDVVQDLWCDGLLAAMGGR